MIDMIIIILTIHIIMATTTGITTIRTIAPTLSTDKVRYLLIQKLQPFVKQILLRTAIQFPVTQLQNQHLVRER